MVLSVSYVQSPLKAVSCLPAESGCKVDQTVHAPERVYMYLAH